MKTQDNAANEKAMAWKLIEKILGQTERVVSRRPDWKIHPDSNTSVVITFSKQGQLFYDVSKKDLEQFSTYKRAFFIFMAGSHKDVFIVPSQELRSQIEAHGMTPSAEYQDYKLHLVHDYRGTYFREIPTLNLTPFLNQYAQLL